MSEANSSRVRGVLRSSDEKSPLARPRFRSGTLSHKGRGEENTARNNGRRPHTIKRAPSCPVMTHVRTAPDAPPAIATGTKCSVRPCVSLSIST